MIGTERCHPRCAIGRNKISRNEGHQDLARQNLLDPVFLSLTAQLFGKCFGGIQEPLIGNIQHDIVDRVGNTRTGIVRAIGRAIGYLPPYSLGKGRAKLNDLIDVVPIG